MYGQHALLNGDGHDLVAPHYLEDLAGLFLPGLYLLLAVQWLKAVQGLLGTIFVALNNLMVVLLLVVLTQEVEYLVFHLVHFAHLLLVFLLIRGVFFGAAVDLLHQAVAFLRRLVDTLELSLGAFTAHEYETDQFSACVDQIYDVAENRTKLMQLCSLLSDEVLRENEAPSKTAGSARLHFL